MKAQNYLLNFNYTISNNTDLNPINSNQPHIKMARGQGLQSKVHFKGNTDDFLVFVEDPALLKKWKDDKTIALVEVVDSFKVFTTGQ